MYCMMKFDCYEAALLWPERLRSVYSVDEGSLRTSFCKARLRADEHVRIVPQYVVSRLQVRLQMSAGCLPTQRIALERVSL